MKITFIGGGNMAFALIGGLKKRGFSVVGIEAIEPSEEARIRLTETFGIRCTASPDASAMACEVLVLAVKPQQMRQALLPVLPLLSGQLVISIAAGLRMADIGRWLGGHTRLVRTMPNTPALIGAGITGLCADAGVSREDRNTAEKILSAVGCTLWIEDEAKMDAVTAISGSGPAYVFYLMEALDQAARELGFSDKESRLLTVETFLGAARLAAESSEPISVLRDRVTSKGGTTAAAIECFNAGGVSAAIGQGVLAAEKRGQELCTLLGQEGEF